VYESMTLLVRNKERQSIVGRLGALEENGVAIYAR